MQAAPLLNDKPAPVLLRPEGAGDAGAAVDWARRHAVEIQALVERAGAVLIRGAGIATPEDFRALCAAVEPDLKTYAGGDSPRSGVADKVYTSTEYDAALEVLLHNELSYAGWSPRLVFFGCLQPAQSGGETHLADGREIYRALPDAIRRRFEETGVVYLQHLWDEDGAPGIGKSWQQTFETDDRAAVEAYLARSGMAWDWTDFGLRTRAPHDAVVTHPKTGERCWWNQADQWHRAIAGVKTSFGAADDPRFDPAKAGEDSLGAHVVYGDGSEIAVEDLMQVRAVGRALEIAFPWAAGDVMLLDNILVQHGRKPFSGPRRVLVAMA